MFLLSLFGLAHFLFLCLSLVLFFLSSILSFFFTLFGSLFLSLSSFYIFFALVSWEEQHQKYSVTSLFHQSFLFWGGLLYCFLFEIPFCYRCFFLILSCVSCSAWMFLSFKKDKTQIVGQEGGCNKRFFNYEPEFCQMWTVIVFGPFWQIWVDVQKNNKRGISAHSLSKASTNTIFHGYYLVQVRVIIWSKLGGGSKNKANLDQIITIKVCARNCLNVLKPYFYSVLTNNVQKAWTRQ